MEQRLSGNTERSSIQWSSILLRAHTAEQLFQGAYAAAPVEQLLPRRTESSMLEHVEPRLTGSTYSSVSYTHLTLPTKRIV